MPLKLRGSSALVFFKRPVHGEKAGIAHGLSDLLHGAIRMEHGFGGGEPHMLNCFIDAPPGILLEYAGGIGGRDAEYGGNLRQT